MVGIQQSTVTVAVIIIREDMFSFQGSRGRKSPEHKGTTGCRRDVPWRPSAGPLVDPHGRELLLIE